MSFMFSTFPRAVRALRPHITMQYRCLYAPIQHSSSTKFSEKRRAFHTSPSLSTAKNPYIVLGVDKNASSSDIKKAYYSAARKYHPDSSKEPNAHEKFQEVQSAYEILSDPEKKQQFDQFGEAGFDPNGQGFHPGAGGPFSGFAGTGGFSGFGGGPFGAEFSFEDLFNAATGGAAGGRKTRGRNPFASEVLVGEDIEVETKISFMDAAKGASKDIHFQALVQCKTCSGSGMKQGTSKKSCGRCGGTGTRVHFMRGGFQMAATCESCGGQGLVTPPGSECSTCSGHGVTKEPRSVGIDIPCGVEDGMRLRITGEGDAPPSGPASTDAGRAPKTKPGDLFVHIRVEPHPKFGRKGSDILYTSTIPLTTALLGGIVKIPTLDNEVDLRVPTGTNTGDRFVISGMGMKNIGGRRGSAGNLKVEFKVNMPKSLTPSQRTLLELLADEFNDKSAKRIMNVSQFAAQKADSDNQGTPPPINDESHHGLLKRIWDKLTNHEHNEGSGGSNAKGS